jgi:hypothetical protein
MKKLGLLAVLTVALAWLVSVPVGEAHGQTAGKDMKITVYNDGKSCPGGCDAHVVMDPSDNGTPNARLPGSPASAPQKCQPGQPCQICFDAALTQCMSVLYRGAGPHKGTFDFTPAFFEEACARPDLPARLAADCQGKRAQAKALDGRNNCIVDPAAPKCVDLMAKASMAKETDGPAYRECKKLGETAYNASQPPARQRSLDCLYEKVGTGKNTAGKTWRKLLPAACGDGQYVGRDGLDCCTGKPLTDGPLDLECRFFYVAK